MVEWFMINIFKRDFSKKIQRTLNDKGYEFVKAKAIPITNITYETGYLFNFKGLDLVLNYNSVLNRARNIL